MKKLFFLMTCLFASVAMFAQTSYQLVADASTLVAGDEVLIVCSSKGMVMGAQSEKYRAGVSVTIADNAISTLPDGTAIVTIEEGSTTGTFALKVSDGYLYWTSGNSVQTQDSSYDWNIVIESDGTASVTSAATPARKLQWNANSPRFACYTSTQTAIQLYKATASTGEGGGEGETPDPTPTPSLTVSAASIDFGSIEEGGAFEAQTLTVTGANLTGVPTYAIAGDFAVEGTLTETTGDLTITCTATAVGTHAGTLTISGDGQTVEVTLSATIKEKLVLGEGEELLATIEFKSTTDGDGSAAKTDIADLIETGATHVSAVTAANVYQGKAGYGLKFSSSSKQGSLTLTLAKSLNATKIVVNAADWISSTSKADGTVLSVNEQTFTLTEALTDYIVTLDGTALSEIVITRTETGKRFYVKSLTIYGTPAEEVTATSIAIAEGASLNMELYREAQLHATLTPAEATTAITWSTSAPEIVAVSETGLLTAAGTGSATITATAGEGVTATCEITVAEATVLLPSAAAEKALTVTTNNAKYEGGQYIVEGYVTEVSDTYSSSFGNMSVMLADAADGTASLEAYQTIPADAENLPTPGAKVRVVGYLTQYNGNAQILKGSHLTVLEAGVVVEDKGLVTVADFLAAKDGINIYTLTGVVSNIANTTYGNFDLTDETGTIYIYGLLDLEGNSKNFENLGIAEGDTVTLKGSYAEHYGSAQIASAQYVSHSKYVAPQPTELWLTPNYAEIQAGGEMLAVAVNFDVEVSEEQLAANLVITKNREDITTSGLNPIMIYVPETAEEGQFELTVTYGGLSMTGYYTILPAASAGPQGMSILPYVPAERVIESLGELQLTADIYPEGEYSVIWTSSDKTLATVTATGLVTSLYAATDKDTTVSIHATIEGYDAIYADAQITLLAAPQPEGLSFDFNGGQAADFGWTTAEEIYNAFLDICNAIENRAAGPRVWVTYEALQTASSGNTIAGGTANAAYSHDKFLTNAEFIAQFTWLLEYTEVVAKAQSTGLPKTVWTGFRWSINHFFANGAPYTNGYGADFTGIGVESEAWKPYFNFYTTPTREGYTFLGWFTDAEATGEALTALPTVGTIYAGWQNNSPTTALDNVNNGVEVIKVIENGQLIIIRDGVRYNVMGVKLQ